tara:strand:+ start:382 stop:627 length:246 start_codon:yes stop_codon:yes gene_type:complete
MKLYNIDQCGYCAMVRDTLERLGLEYQKIDVPWSPFDRGEVVEVSGQHTVPVLVDGNTVLADENDIINYLKENYPGRNQNK